MSEQGTSPPRLCLESTNDGREPVAGMLEMLAGLPPSRNVEFPCLHLAQTKKKGSLEDRND